MFNAIRANKALIVALSVTVLTSSVTVAGIQYAEFSDTSTMAVNRNAGQAGNVLRLTPSAPYRWGTAYHNDKQDILGGFDTTFAFRLTNNGGSTGYNGGCGIAFIIQDQGLTAIGGPGSGNGYATSNGYPGISNSLAVDFQCTRAPGLFDNYISVQTMGLQPNLWTPEARLGINRDIPAMDDGAVHTGRIRYVPGMLDVFLDNSPNPTLSVGVDLASLLSLDQGKAWVGFGAGTGEAWRSHDVLSWSFVPEPASVLLLVLGGLLINRRRRG